MGKATKIQEPSAIEANAAPAGTNHHQKHPEEPKGSLCVLSSVPRQASGGSTNRQQSHSPSSSKSRYRSKGRAGKQEHRSRSKTPKQQPKCPRRSTKAVPGQNIDVAVSWASAAFSTQTTPHLGLMTHRQK
ncbi:hypothetical protein HPB48_023388 [Haemaphysalis longicornis]|uniref:Uncharacterized protein n=1 Tax=Haemaphysalis longicornis TaxID=44386 RepID=A0A9J6H709_HAELO|nr:hypothetical protein HPB48_023388 [Haemaphysalis longicornis]